MFSPMNAVIGAGCGWFVMGPRGGEGLRTAFGVGLTTVAAMLFWGLLLHSGTKMIQLSMNRHYDGPVAALVGMFDLAIGYGKLIATPQIITTLVLGGLFGGWFTEWVARRWP